MKFGLVADIHEDVERLKLALDRLSGLGAERFVMLGDVFDRGDRGRLDAVAALLDRAGAVGVWGNHDLGLCVDPDDHVVATISTATLGVMARLQPRLVIDDCHFSHVEPWLDPTTLEGLWWIGDLPNTPERVAQSFGAVPQRLIVMGDAHRWILATPGEVFSWQGEGPYRLDPDRRYFLVVHAVCEGWCALLDTGGNVLTPVGLDP